MTTGELPTWLPLPAAASRFGLSHWMLRRLVREGALSRTSFSAASKQPPIFLRSKEVAALAEGGIDAVRRVQARAKAAKRGAAK